MEEAIRRHGAAVYRLAWAYMRTPHDADDVFQDVFLCYAEKAPEFMSTWTRRRSPNCWA